MEKIARVASGYVYVSLKGVTASSSISTGPGAESADPFQHAGFPLA